MRSDPISPLAVLRALELFGPQARPYNFDDCFDCWGLVRRVVDHLDDGDEVNGELDVDAAGRESAGWGALGDPGELMPGDLLVTHPHASAEFHTVFFCGRVGGRDLVYDASPRAQVPLFARRSGEPPAASPGDGWRLVTARAVFTRYARATETTDRLRNDGGAYLRLWDDRARYFHRGWRARLFAGAAADPALAGLRAAAGAPAGFSPVGLDLVALRRAAGLADVPFYCRRRLPRDAVGRELYDNLTTRHLDYYVPDGAPVPDDEVVAGRPPRPNAPRIVDAPLWVVRDAPVTVAWEYLDGQATSPAMPGGPVNGCRVEVWEETADLWKYRLLRRDFDEPVTEFVVPPESLHDDARFAVVVWARGPGGFSGTALAPFLYRPSLDNPLLTYDPVRPESLAPDGGEEVPAGEPLELTWSIRRPLESQAGFRVEVLEDASPADAAAPVYQAEIDGPRALACRTVVPGEALRAGHTYGWYVTVRTADGRTAFAPSEGVFHTRKG
jgi:hypothetical protein